MQLCKIFDISLPLIQSPMAGAQDSELCIAVSEAGGLGSLPCAMLSSEEIDEEVKKIREKTDKPFNLNFFCHADLPFSEEKERIWRQKLAPYYKEFEIDPPKVAATMGRQPFSQKSLDIVKRLKPAALSFHFGLPDANLWDQVKASGIKTMSSATTRDEALWLESQGVDVIIAQGLEAGGHRGHFLSHDLTLQKDMGTLLKQILEVVKIPVVAAGGIFDGISVKSAINIGAAGVQVGTSYLLCNESKISHLHRGALKSLLASETQLTNLFSGRPARGLKNRLMKECGPISDQVPNFPMAGTATQGLKKIAESKGSVDFSSLWSGTNNHGCREISADEMTKSLSKHLDLGSQNAT
ncbi:MAG: nitronate monooxygenase [Candidatus Azotimanducaceae bacterium]|jgi:nitronate monooxygenase